MPYMPPSRRSWWPLGSSSVSDKYNSRKLIYPLRRKRAEALCSLGEARSSSILRLRIIGIALLEKFSRNRLAQGWHKEIVVVQKNLHILGVVRYLEADMDMWC